MYWVGRRTLELLEFIDEVRQIQFLDTDLRVGGLLIAGRHSKIVSVSGSARLFTVKTDDRRAFIANRDGITPSDVVRPC